MIQATNVALSYGKRVIFKDVNIKFTPGNCYGLIGANGAGKSTFLKILAGEIEPDHGTISVGSRERIAVLNQDQFAFDEETVFNTVLMGHKRLYELMSEREAIYARTAFSEADGIRCGEIEAEFADINGYEAESEAAVLLNGLGISEDLRRKKMKELDGTDKVRVLLAQALLGNPDVLLLDEPTNHLDQESIAWLEDFLARFPNTVIIVSHDRHFLNQVCTHVADIDFGRIQVYAGNYDFWYQTSRLHLKQKQSENKKIAAKADELKEFIQRFSANASKARQATSRKRLLEKLTLEDMPVSSRKYPFIVFKPERPCGDVILEIKGLSKEIDGIPVLKDINLTVNRGDKIAFVGGNSLAKTTLFQILAGEILPDSGSFRWGVTITAAYFPQENSGFFNNDLNLVEWLTQFAPPAEGPTFARGFLGKMLFSGEEALKKASVLSGGERVRCMLSKMMLTGANVLILDEPTNHLDLESIISLNDGLITYPEVVLAKELPSARVVATDISAGALEVARHNAARHGVAERIEFLLGDLFTPVSGSFDLIVSNPPYIPDAMYPLLPDGIRAFEPRQALVAGPDGTTVHREIIRKGANLLNAGGWIFLEIGDEQSRLVEALLRETGAYDSICFLPDYGGADRVAAARRKP